eukprot:1159403-Pelagomonas_calceolata.AAC.2
MPHSVQKRWHSLANDGISSNSLCQIWLLVSARQAAKPLAAAPQAAALQAAQAPPLVGGMAVGCTASSSTCASTTACQRGWLWAAR